MAQSLTPEPDTIALDEQLHPAEVLPRLEQVATELGQLTRAVHLLHTLAEPLTEPAQLTTVELTAATRSRLLDERGIDTASIAVINPSAVTVFLGIGGGRASSQARAIPIASNRLIVLPLAAGDVEVGAEAELPQPAVVHLLRYRTVQQAFVGSL